MKKSIHPENYRLVAFKDMSNEHTFITKSATSTKDTIEIDGVEYDLNNDSFYIISKGQIHNFLYAKNLEGNLLFIHGTGDDNVHYQNAELLLNELIKYNKQFQFMPYPNRSHGLSEGEGTFIHLSTLYTNYLKLNCPPGGR